MPSSETRSRVRSSRTASGSEPQICSRAPVRRWISGQARSSTCSPLRVSCRPANVTVCSRCGGVDGVGDEHAVRDDLVVARAASGPPSRVPARRRRSARRSGSRESPRQASRASSSRARPTRDASRRSVRWPSRAPRCTSPASSARAGGARRSCSRSSTRRIRKIARGLRMMFGSEPFAGTITERPIGITFAGGDAVPADPRVEGTRELPGWVVAHHQAYLVPARLQRFGLELGVLDDGAPERPRERHHDADLHAWSLFTPRSRRGARAPRSRRMRVARCRRSDRGNGCARLRGASGGPVGAVGAQRRSARR